jgi:hypothetical protein
MCWYRKGRNSVTIEQHQYNRTYMSKRRKHCLIELNARIINTVMTTYIVSKCLDKLPTASSLQHRKGKDSQSIRTEMSASSVQLKILHSTVNNVTTSYYSQLT